MPTTRRDFLKLSTLAASTFQMSSDEILEAHSLSNVLAKAPTILLRSSWNDNNIGDIGHTPGTLRLLERHIPEAQIILWHAQPRPVTEALIVKNFPKVKIVHGAFFNQDEGLQGELKTAFEQADVYIHNSGMSMNFGLFHYEWGATMGNLAPFYYCIENNIPFGLYGQSFDKFAPPSLSLYRDVLNRASFIYCRDAESVKFLKENQFKTPIIEFGPDGCFGIDVRDETKGLAYLRQAGLEEGKFLVVVVRTNTPHLNATGKGDMMNPAPSPEQQQQDALRLGKVKDLINQWVTTTGMKVLIAPEALKETKYAKTMLYDQLEENIKAKVVCRETFWSADEAMSVYARAHTMFGMEPHSLIMGLALGVPVVHARPLKHGRKGWMFRDIGVPEWLFEIDQAPASDITGAVLTIYKDYKTAKAKAQKAMDVVRNRQKETMAVVKKLAMT
ncbi:polysaccharide pyruvyl transferase family protein [Runella sp. MFBS21]|uniref:polysaccharide pyruvyl transferase family protein n=1 Tax=Runella sp. MFBS21 TaxID=3034018 RepID=UPI0023F92F62|nr:polysaccharide pyruvyl transferase family protein [Runella sp. MFBS21]MDF7816662.1 polysaccharide pyruvyl transferase family protein [Runella sp. MFBS21]